MKEISLLVLGREKKGGIPSLGDTVSDLEFVGFSSARSSFFGVELGQVMVE